MTDRLPSTSLAPSIVQLGTRNISIDNRPLPKSSPWDGSRRTVELKQLTEDCMVLEPKKGAFLWHALIILGLSLGPLVGSVFVFVTAINEGPGWVAFLFCSIGVLVWLGLLFLGLHGPSGYKRWVRFDRRAGLLTISRRPFGFRWQLKVIQSRPLKDLVCIQLLHSGFQSDSYEIGEPGTPGSVVHQNYHSYQMNLVFDGGQESRYNLASHSDWIWIREAGQKLADFVGVPVVDQLYHVP